MQPIKSFTYSRRPARSTDPLFLRLFTVKKLTSVGIYFTERAGMQPPQIYHTCVFLLTFRQRFFLSQKTVILHVNILELADEVQANFPAYLSKFLHYIHSVQKMHDTSERESLTRRKNKLVNYLNPFVFRAFYTDRNLS